MKSNFLFVTKIKNKIDNFMCSTYKHSFVLPLIITNLDINEQNTPIGKFAYAVLIFSFISLFCFINILGYGIAYFLIQNSKYKNEKNYPLLSKLINRYIQIGKVYIIVEISFCLISLLI